MGKFSKHNSRGAKLDAGRVRALREDYAGGASQGELARKYGLSVGQVGRIVRGEAWQYLQDDAGTAERAQESAERLRALTRMQEAIKNSPERTLSEFIDKEGKDNG